MAETCTGSSVSCPADSVKPSTEICRASAGVCDLNETCDGAGTACPAQAFEPSTTVCRGAANDCDAAENCTGTGAACPADVFQPDGANCDDTQTCTVADMCVAGVCAGDSNVCGDGTLQGSCNEECDDGNVVNGDGCSATCQKEFGCDVAPAVGCRLPVVSAKAQLQLANKAPDIKDRLRWKWAKGAATTIADFGTPLTTTDYAFCVYDAGTLVAKIKIPAGGTCAGKPCWSVKSTSMKYKDKDLTPDGIQQLKLKTGVNGKAQIQIKGRGDNLPMPTLPFTQPVRAQLLSSDGVCWEATFSAPASKNVAEQFKDKGD